MNDALVRTSLSITALPATELIGFSMRDDMRDTLIIAVSQSGTITDTNRTVDLVRQRGATVLAIVNRRELATAFVDLWSTSNQSASFAIAPLNLGHRSHILEKMCAAYARNLLVPIR